MTHSNVAEKCKSRTKSRTSFDQELCKEIVDETLTGVDRTKKEKCEKPILSLKMICFPRKIKI
jgi:hypothetical protein